MSSPTRMRRTSTATGGRFGRAPASGRSRRTPQRRLVAGGWLQRRQPPKQSSLQRIMGGRGGKAGGMALLAGAAGMLLKNRDKLTSRMRRDRDAPLS
jgi:hypothetical protein